MQLVLRYDLFISFYFPLTQLAHGMKLYEIHISGIANPKRLESGDVLGGKRVPREPF